MIQELEQVCHVKNLVAFEVKHCWNAFGCLIKTLDGKKFVFSGDTKKCKNLINYAKNATVLIHEATIASEYKLKADLKRHCTV